MLECLWVHLVLVLAFRTLITKTSPFQAGITLGIWSGNNVAIMNVDCFVFKRLALTFSDW